jgi:hypothetical protein
MAGGQVSGFGEFQGGVAERRRRARFLCSHFTLVSVQDNSARTTSITNSATISTIVRLELIALARPIEA